MGIVKKEKTPLTQNQKNKILYYSLAFGVPFLIMLISFIKLGIRPFGDNSLLGMDLWSQYFPMLRHQYESRRQLAVDIFSWDGALGIDTFVQNAYYCNSPFNLLLLLSPLKYLVDALDYLILFKFGLAGLTFAVYCKYKFGKLDLYTVAFSSAYALCSYCLAFISQVMWFDCVIFFPLILMGMERLISENKPFLYCAVLAVTIYSGFYISFSICLFLIIYFFVYSAENFNTLKIKGVFKSGLRFALYSLLAGGLAAFVILPVYFGLGRTIASEIPAPSAAELYNSIFEYLANLFPMTPVSLQFDVPNIYSGCFILLLIPLFLMNKNISVRRKILYSALVVFLYFSMNLNFLDYAWHGMHFPNQLPGRWTFIFSFVVIIMSYEAVRNFRAVTPAAVPISGAAAVAVLLLVRFVPDEPPLSTESTILGSVFICIYLIVMIMMTHYEDGKYKSVSAVLLAVCIMVEMFSNSVFVLFNGTEVGDVPKYTAYDDEMKYFKENYADSDEDFYRSELYYNWTFDHCQLFGLKGITYYSSTMDGNAYKFFKDLGYRVYAKNVSTVYCPYSPVLNAVFGIKYVANISMQKIPDYFKKIDSVGSIDIWENQKFLPVMFASSDEILSWQGDDKLSFYESQNMFFSAIMGRKTEIFKLVPGKQVSIENARITAGGLPWTSEVYVTENKSEDVNIKYTYTLENDGELYLCQNYKKGDMKVSLDGEDVTVILYREPTKYLGSCEKGDTVEISVASSGVGVGTSALDLYYFDRELFNSCIDELAAKSECSAEVKNSVMRCNVRNKADSLMFTSVPANGMTCEVDGAEAEIELIGDYLAAVRVPAGEHNITFRYKTAGFYEGLGISAACFVLLAVIVIVKIYKRKKSVAPNCE